MNDVDQMRAATLALHALPGVDTPWTFYCDETNNIRRLRVGERGLNVAEPACFVIGGIVHDGPERPFDLVELRRAIEAQPGVVELKLKHLGSGGALDLLDSKRLGPFLDWLEGEALLAHWSVLDPIYWSVVDIIDSILVERAPQLFGVAPLLKSDLCVALRRDLADTARPFQTYGYPDVQPDAADAFLADLRERVSHSPDLDEFNQRMLMDVLKLGRGLDDLPFLAGETPGVLIDSFVDFYLHRFYLLVEARHILDTEPEIMTRLAARPLTRGGQTFRNYRFVDRSHDEDGIQIADMVTGLLGKVFTWIRDSDAEAIEAARDVLSDRARDNLHKLSRLMDRSTDACPAFAHMVLSVADQAKGQAFFRP